MARCQRSDQPADLAGDEALGLPERRDRRAGDRHGMEVGERVDRRDADAAPHRRVVRDLGRHRPPDDDAVAALHHEEGRADHGRILAQHEDPRGRRIVGPERGERTILAHHVVRARRDRPERRPAQHVLPIAEAQEIGQVGVPAWELQNLERLLALGKLAAEIRGDDRPIELLVRTNRCDVGGVGHDERI